MRAEVPEQFAQYNDSKRLPVIYFRQPGNVRHHSKNQAVPFTKIIDGFIRKKPLFIAVKQLKTFHSCG